MWRWVLEVEGYRYVLGGMAKPHLPERNQELRGSKLKGPNPIVTKHAVHGSPPLPLCLFILKYTYSAHLPAFQPQQISYNWGSIHLRFYEIRKGGKGHKQMD